MARKKAAEAESAAAEPATGTPPARGAKGEAIRAYLSENPGAGAKAVVEALQAKGLTVSQGMVGAIKYGGGKKKTKKPGRPAKKAAAAETSNGTPSPSAHGGKTEAVRSYLKENPMAPAKSVMGALKAQGINVSLALVGAIKHGKGKKKGRKLGRPRKSEAMPATVSSSGEKGLSVEDLLGAKALVDALGGVSQARKALEVLESLR